MSERAICRFHRGHEFNPWEPDPDAPSVAEIVEVLRQCQESQRFGIRVQIDRITAQLEGK